MFELGVALWFSRIYFHSDLTFLLMTFVELLQHNRCCTSYCMSAILEGVLFNFFIIDFVLIFAVGKPLIHATLKSKNKHCRIIIVFKVILRNDTSCLCLKWQATSWAKKIARIRQFNWNIGHFWLECSADANAQKICLKF